jgi:hypothetical protein
LLIIFDLTRTFGSFYSFRHCSLAADGIGKAVFCGCFVEVKMKGNSAAWMNRIIALVTAMLMTAAAGIASAELRDTTSPDALCNNGEQATYAYFEGTGNDWLVYIHGGGVVTSADQYRNRMQRFTKPQETDDFGAGVPMVRDFREKGFNVIVMHYCTGDLYQGFHTHQIDGKTVYFHGRKIVENIIDIHKNQLAGADRLVFAGYSAGSLALGFNADLIAQFDAPYVVSDSFWLEPESLRVRLGWTQGPWVNITKFLYGNLPEHCKGDHWAHCFPSRPQFTKHGIDKVFPIWNIGDNYARHGDQNKVKAGIISDIEHYGAGYSIDAKAKQIKGFEEWGHVMTANELYEKQIDGVVLRELIWDWIDGKAKTTHIDH